MGIGNWFRREAQSSHSSPAGAQRAVLEALEPRLLLDAAPPSVDGITALHDNFRFIAGQGVPDVMNTYDATVSGDVTSVTFAVGGLSETDTDPADGWSASFNMTQCTTTDDLLVTAVGPGWLDSQVLPVPLLLLPDWLGETDVQFACTHDWAAGYNFDVTVAHFEQGFTTPAEWQFSVPGVDEYVLDLGDKWTGFVVSSEFVLTSAPDGTVVASGYQFGMTAEILDQLVFDREFDLGTTGSEPYQWQAGGVDVTGTVDYGADLTPVFDNDLLLTGITGTAYVDPNLMISMPLGEARVPLLSVPGVADLVFGADADITFAYGAGNMVVITPAVSGGGFGLQQFDMHPAIGVDITGYGEVEVLMGAGNAAADITGRLDQGLDAVYQDPTGWEPLAAPGSLTLGATTYYSTLWGFGPSGVLDLFNWQVGSWDFLAGGDAVQFDQGNGHDPTVLDVTLVSEMLGYEGAPVEFVVDYLSPTGSAPQAAKLILDNADHDMTLQSGTPTDGVYTCQVSGVRAGEHEFSLVFVDELGVYYTTQTLQGLTDDAFRGNHTQADAFPLYQLNAIYSNLVIVPDAQGVGAEDWFAIYLQDEAPADSLVTLSYDDRGDLDLQVVDEQLDPVGAMSYPDAYTEVCDLAGVAKGLYYVRVHSQAGDTSPDYDLTFNVTTEAAASIVEVIDRSGSMWGSSLQGAKTAAYLFLQLLDAGDKIGIVSYASDVTTDFPLTTITASSFVPETLFTDSMDNLANWTADAPWDLTGTTYHSANLCVTDSPIGNYADDTDTSLTLNDPITLPADEDAVLKFWTKHNIEYWYDFGRVEVSANGGPWTEVGTLMDVQASWVERTFWLSDFKGQDVRIRFRLVSDYLYNYDGWYIDDVTVVTQEMNAREQAAAAIEAIEAGGATGIGAGVEAANEQLNRFPDDPVRAMIVLSDGQQNTPPDPIDVINAEVDEDIRVFTVGFGPEADTARLTEMANLRNGQYFHASNGLELQIFYTMMIAQVAGQQQLLGLNGTIFPDERLTQQVHIDASVTQVSFGLNWAGSDLDLELKAPDGTIITHDTAATDPDIQLVDGPTYEFFKIFMPAAGVWEVSALAVDVPAEGELYHMYSLVKSAITASVETDSTTYEPGEPVDLQVVVSDGQPILQATVVATIEPPDDGEPPIDVVLYDDGAHGDGAAADGVYANVFTQSRWGGSYAVDVDVDGTANAGFDFSRAPSTSFLVSADLELLPPVADANGPYEGPVGEPIAFDAGGSTDPDGQIALYEWDWDLDGEYDDATADPGIEHTWTQPFAGNVRLRVTDNDGKISTDTAFVDCGLYVAIGDGEADKLSFRDGDGTVIDVQLKKGGTVTVHFVGSDFEQRLRKGVLTVKGNGVSIGRIVFDDTTVRSELIINADQRGDGLATVGKIVGSTPLGKLKAKNTDLVGEGILLTGDGYVGFVELNDVDKGANIIMPGTAADGGVRIETDRIYDDTDIELGSGLDSLTATEWLGGSLTAPWAGNVTIKGDPGNDIIGNLGVDVTLSGEGAPKGVALGRVKVPGEITRGTWAVTGAGGDIKVGATRSTWTATFSGDVKSIKTTGNKRWDIAGDLSGAWTSKSLGKVFVEGSFANATLTLTQTPDPKIDALGKMKVGEWFGSAETGAAVHAWIVSSGNIGKIIVGAIRNAAIFAGVTATADGQGAGGAPDGVLDLPDPAADLDLDNGASIAKLKVKGIKGEQFGVINANFAAAEMGSISLHYPRSGNDGVPFGLAADFIKRLEVKDVDGRSSFSDLDDAEESGGFEDSLVRLV